MAATNGHSVPTVSTEAVLKQSIEMPAGAQKVEEIDFNKFAGRSITVEDLISGSSNMGFQASSIGEAVRIINEMVRPFSERTYLIANPSRPELACSHPSLK